MLQVPAPACWFGRIGRSYGAVRAWTFAYVVRRLARKPRCARSRRQMLKLQPDSARLAAQHLHRGRGAAQARPRWRRMASHVKPAGPGWSCGTTRLCRRRVRPRTARYASSTSRLLMGAATCSATPFVSANRRDDSVWRWKMIIYNARDTYKRQGHLRTAHSHDTESRSSRRASSVPLGDNVDGAGK